MERWRRRFIFDPISPLSASGNEAVRYFTMRDLLGEKAESIGHVWRLPEARKMLQKQLSDGSWKYSGKAKTVYPKHHHSLVETWKMFRLLVEQYGLTKDHEAARRAAGFIFSCQTRDGDVRGFIGNQYATYYTGAIMAILIKAGYERDPRIKKGFKWLLSMRQDDGGWTVPILTHRFSGRAMYRLTSRYAVPVEPDRSKPFSHICTDMVLRAFAAHPSYRNSEEARTAADLLKSRFFQPDSYSSYRAASYWVRFLFWWPNIITALDSLSLMGYRPDDPDIRRALDWLIDHQEISGLWRTTYAEGQKETENVANKERKLWLTLAICRIFKRFYE